MTLRIDTIWTATMLVLSLLGSATALSQTETPNLDALDQLVADAITDYPSIEAAWADVRALETRSEQVDQPFDPTVTAGLMYVPIDSFRFDENGMAGVRFGLQQRFYWPGVLDARVAAADAAVEAQHNAIPEIAIRIWRRASLPFFQIVDMDRMSQALTARRDILAALYDAARARYEARAVPLTDVFRVSTEISRVDQELLRVQRERRIALADLNGLLQRGPDTQLQTSPQPDPIADSRSTDEWLALGLSQRPAFAHLDSREVLIGVQQVSVQAEDDPMWSVALGYSLRFQDEPDGSDLISVVFGISLPFFSSRRVDAQLDEFDARLIEIDAERHELVRSLRADIGSHLTAMASLEDEITSLDQDLIPSVEDTYQAALAHYASSHANVEALIELQDRLLELEVARAHLVSMHDLRRAQLRVLAADSEIVRDAAWSQQ